MSAGLPPKHQPQQCWQNKAEVTALGVHTRQNVTGQQTLQGPAQSRSTTSETSWMIHQLMKHPLTSEGRVASDMGVILDMGVTLDMEVTSDMGVTLDMGVTSDMESLAGKLPVLGPPGQ